MISEASKEDFLSIYGIGEVVAESLENWFSDTVNKNLIKNLLKHVTIVPDEISSSKKLEGKTFVFTGTMPTLDRDAAEEMVRKNGGSVSGSVSKKTSYVVAGGEAGSKLEKARSLDVAIISEKEFLDLIK